MHTDESDRLNKAKLAYLFLAVGMVQGFDCSADCTMWSSKSVPVVVLVETLSNRLRLYATVD